MSGLHPLLRLTRRLRTDRRGNIAIMGALTLPLIVAAAALGIDWGYLGYQKRDAQADTDLAAISAAANLGAARDAIQTYLANNDLPYTVASEAGDGSPASASDLDTGRMTYALGHYAADGTRKAYARFTAGGTPYNAVRVRFVKRADLSIGRAIMQPPRIATEAIAGTNGIAAFSIGSRLASLHGGILNALLGKLLGTTVDLDVMDYRSLLDTDVNVLSFLDSVGTRLNLQADDYRTILGTQLTVGQFLGAMANTHGLSANVRQIVGRLADATGGNDQRTLTLASLLDLGDVAELAPGDGNAAIAAEARVLDMISATGAIANGEHQIALDIGTDVPGLVKLAVTLSIGEPPAGSAWFAVGGQGTIVRTAQTRLKLDATVGGGGLLSGVKIELPIYLEVANAVGEITGVACTGTSSDSASVDVSARPGIAEAWIGDLGDDDLSRLSSQGSMQLAPARIVDLGLLGLRVEATAHAAIANPRAETLQFSPHDIGAKTVKTVSTRAYASSLLPSLIGDLRLEVHVAGLSLLTPTLVQKALAATLRQATAPIDDALYNILLTLGIRVGEADVRVTGVKCDRPVLVQ